MSAPSLPPRPARLQNHPATLAPKNDIPQIPPRPKRSVERSISPNRDTFARSPLNDPTFHTNGNRNGVHSQKALSAPNLPQRPPSVTLPSIGQEGNEYANFEEYNEQGSPTQTKSIAGDLPLHAPKASVPASTAKSRIATVTRTDSSTAVAAGIGKAYGEGEDKGQHNFTRSSSSAGTRPQSIHKEDHEEHGIPEIGLQVPMYPNAGDVQAPTPSPYSQPNTPGIGFYNDGSHQSGRHHGRTKSGREIFKGPPGSYGLHGHGIPPQDEFERAWYEKHPEALAREAGGEYGPAIPESRKEWVMSSEELNKLVRESANKGIGMGTSPAVIGTPDEQIGYLASEEYASRMTSPRPPSVHVGKPRTSSSHMHAESPLRKMSFPVNDTIDPVKAVKDRSVSDAALESEAEEDVIHVDPPSRRASKIHGGGYDPPTEDLGPHGGNTEEEGGWITEQGYGAPILASDEVAKTPGAEYMQPAISPEMERRGEEYHAGYDSEHPPMYQSGRRNSHPVSRPSSRPASRPGSIHAAPAGLQKFLSHDDREGTGTPLDNVKEYEPLFPDEDDEKKKKPTIAVERLKRPDLARHHFPSQDVWEDTPNSLQLQTEVETPQIPDEPDAATSTEAKPSQVFEPPEAENERMRTLTPGDQKDFIPEHTKQFAKSHFNKDVLGDMPTRPGMAQRFPSRDIWEDTPDYSQLETTVDTPQMDESNEITSPVETRPKKPEIPPRPAKAEQDDEGVKQPTIPARPPQRLRQLSPTETKQTSPTERKAPTIPDRPKPQIPPRPTKPTEPQSPEDAPLAKTTSAGSTGSDNTAAAPAPKPKPAVPARPAGGKIAALKAGFMNDLNTRLQIGPQAPRSQQEPVREAEAAAAAAEQEEKAPLSDARKGRARGPARRKPAASPSGAATGQLAERSTASLAVAGPWTVWEIAEDGRVFGAGDAESSGSSGRPTPPSAEEGESPVKDEKAGSVAGAAVKDERKEEGKEEEKEAPSTEPAPKDEQAASPSLVEKVKSLATSVFPSALAGPSSTEEEPPAEEMETASAEPSAERESPAAERPPDSGDRTASAASQTGQFDIKTSGPGGKTERFTAYVDALAPEGGSVIVRDGEERVDKADEGRDDEGLEAGA